MNWKEKRFSEIIEFPPKIKLERDEKYDFIPMANVDGGVKYVKEIEMKKYTGGGAKFESGDTLFARITPCLENGKIAKVKELEKGKGFGSTEFFVFRAIPNVSDPDFIYYLSKTENIRQPAIKSMVGASGRQRADKGVVEDIMVKIPPLPTQKRIASILSAYDDLIENNLKRIQLLEEAAQNIYREWFVHFRYPGHEEVLINEETGLPDGWEVKVIKDVCSIKGGKRIPKGENLSLEKTEHPYIRVKDLNDTSIDLSNIHYISESTYLKIKRYTISTDEIYISNAGTIGKVGIIPESIDGANLTENCAKLSTIRDKNMQNYLCLFLQSSLGQGLIRSKTGGASQPKLALYRIGEIEFILPDKDILMEFGSLVNSIMEFREVLEKKNLCIKEARDILLPRLMNQTIEV